ncbi:LysM peptidoglycan-binding domain-containing protein [Nonlabens agnitus]|uniref:Lytic transglycosylase n=1 Tax=Nonlabens agnitus TaxID=870484 RepID=A0A2S9WWB7_9FLAO|nr:LysM peptidoglycan-binding domain-containing protein [Nonlabens agnitus]PRP67770.1 lytic transglycosylase [Nonlabens agnitus]
MNRIKKVSLCVLGCSMFAATAQQPAVETVLKDTIQIKQLEGNLEIQPVKASDTLGMATFPEVDTYDQRFQELLYSHDGFEYMFDREDEVVDLDLSDVELSTDTLKARLQRINQGTPFQIDYNPILENLIKKKLKYNRVYLERIMTLSDYYFPLFEEQLDRFDVPLEMKYLAIVESALDPKIKSRVGATGLWQFMLPTGRLMGLEVDSYVDERMDPMKSTIAACKYLNKLYDIYEDWDLALAAYNSGAGNVNKAIRRSGGRKNYWNLRPYLPRETADYVPQFQAMMYLYTYAAEHGFKPQRPSRLMMGTDTVLVKKKIHFDHIAQALDVDTEMIQYYNPSYKLDIIPVIEGKPHYLRLPKDQIASFVGNEEKVYAFAKAESDKAEKPDPNLLVPQSSITYTVRKGDYLGKIANKYRVNVSQIKRWNGLRSNNLKIGQRLKIMTRGSVATTASTSSTYKVKSGDSLWEIGKKHGVSVAQLKKLNPDKTSTLRPGMTLNLK